MTRIAEWFIIVTDVQLETFKKRKSFILASPLGCVLFAAVSITDDLF